MKALPFLWLALLCLIGPVWALDSNGAEAALAERVQRLEQDLADLRQASALSKPEIARAPTPPIGGTNAFNPAISLILNGQYTDHSQDPSHYVRAGFPLTGEAGPSAQGLSLGESELSLSSAVDDQFYGRITLALGSDAGQDELGIEEAYIESTALPWGLTLRGGRFLSNIGYLNSHHAHTDKFADRPLPYQAFLGNAYHDDGLQLRWVAPSDVFIALSAELMRGQAYPSAGAERRGVGTQTLAMHFGGDAGAAHSWLAGASVLRAKTLAGEDGFNGKNTVFIVDGTWKWAPKGNPNNGGLTLRGEYFQDKRHGEYIDPAALAPSQAWDGARKGAYLEGIYRLSRQWELGYRRDSLWAANTGPYASPFKPTQDSFMLAWRNSEFSMVRLHLSEDSPNPASTNHSLTLQYQMTLGAHGAHQF